MKRHILLYRFIVLAVILLSDITEGGAQTYDELGTSLTSRTLSGYQKLQGDTDLTGTITVREILYLDLNGYTLKGDGSNRIFRVIKGALVIEDSSESKSGKVTDGNAGEYQGGFCRIEEGGSLTITGGSISGCEATIGGAICINAGGSLIFTGGTISDCSATSGGAIYVRSGNNPGGSIYMSGGTISGCTATENGGAITFEPGGSMIMEGGTISDCSATDNGGGVFVKGTLTMNAGTISRCTATNGGGGAIDIYDAGTFYMNHGTISGCEADLGGAIRVTQSASMTMTGGIITGCAATSNGGGFDVRGTLTMNAGTVSGCTAGNHGSGMYLYGGTFIMKGGQISGNMPTRVSGKGISYNTFTTNGKIYNVPSGIDGLAEFAGGCYGGGIYMSGAEATFEMSGGSVSNNIATSGGGVFVHNNATFSMSGTAELSGNIAAGTGGYGNGGAVYLDSGNFTINGELASDGNPTVKITGNKASRYGGAVNTNRGGQLMLTGACRISGNIASHGGGLSQEQGLCNMSLTNSGIFLSDNYASRNGGGLFIEKGTLTVNGATISDNIANERGGGAALYVKRIAGDIQATISGNAIISNNYAGTSGGGIDLYAGPDASLVDDIDINEQPDNNSNLNSIFVYLDSGTISGNKAENGAGIYVSIEEGNNAATMNVGPEDKSDTPIIKDNYATNNGGGLGMNRGTFNVFAGNLTGNSARNGGAIYLADGTFDVKGSIIVGGDIGGNSASQDGGGIYMGNGTFNLTTGSFIKNTAGRDGGGIYMDNGDFTISEYAVLKQNSANEGNGGGLFLGAGNLTVESEAKITVGADALASDATTDTNTAENGSGGGIYCAGNLDVEGEAIIRGNKAENGGGSCVSNGTVTIAEGSISNNSAKVYGGGLYVENKTDSRQKATFSGGVFTNNQAAAGGGICATGDIFLTLHATLEFNTAKNGGGIYLQDGVDMYFGTGLIRMNNAIGENASDKKSAYHCNHEDIEGVGGGIFMGDETSLVFKDPNNPSSIDELGIYNNTASFAANDIFANGNATSATLPDISKLDLRGLIVKGNQLYWVEDYVTDDIHYNDGTKQAAGAIRYEAALYQQGNFTLGLLQSDLIDPNALTKYACLDLGFDMVFVKLVKKGLLTDDDAAFELFSNTSVNPEEEPEWASYCKVLFIGTGEDIERKVGLPSGEWKIEATQWNWKYKNLNITPADGYNTRGYIPISRTQNTVIEISSEIKTDEATKNVSGFQFRKVNIMRRQP